MTEAPVCKECNGTGRVKFFYLARAMRARNRGFERISLSFCPYCNPHYWDSSDPRSHRS